jgi:hypothetical protein
MVGSFGNAQRAHAAPRGPPIGTAVRRLRQEPANRVQPPVPPGKRVPESVAVGAKIGRKQKGTVMHIASGLALVRRDPAQSDRTTGGAARRAWFRTPGQIGASRARLRKMLPGAILLIVLALLGALFPIVF